MSEATKQAVRARMREYLSSGFVLVRQRDGRNYFIRKEPGCTTTASLPVVS